MKKQHLTKSSIGGLTALALAVPLALATVASVAAKDLRVAIGLPEAHAHSQGWLGYEKYIEENSDMQIKVFYLSLLKLPEVPDGLRDGVADIGDVVTAYKPAEYADMNLVADLSMLATSGTNVDSASAAMSGAMMEYVLFNCPECQNEFTKQNSVFLGSASTAPYTLLCTQPINSLAEMKGKKFRSGAANFGRWAESVGGIKVSMPGNEIYEAMSQGVVDCAMLAVSTLIEQSLHEVTQQLIFGVPGGVFAGLAQNTVNKDTWQSLTPEQRAVLIKGTPGLVADTIVAHTKLDNEGQELGESKGIEFVHATDETLAAYTTFVEQDMASIAEQFESKYNLTNVPEKIETFKGLLKKWKGLTKDIGHDRAGLEKVYWDEVISKIDQSTYGLN